MKIYLIRHGNFIPMWDGDGYLSEKGDEQINRLRERFIEEGIEFDNVYHSPLIRARDSAEKLNMGEMISLNGLVESNQDMRGGVVYESEEEIIRRMKWSLDHIKSNCEGDCFGVISHCYSIRDLLNSFSSDSKLLPHTGVVLLDYSSKEPRILDYDSEKHLEGIWSS